MSVSGLVSFWPKIKKRSFGKSLTFKLSFIDGVGLGALLSLFPWRAAILVL